MIEIIGWLATGLILLGYYLNANKKDKSWLAWFIGNIFMAWYSVEINAWPQVGLAIVLMIMNIYGYINWLRLKNE